MINNIGKIKWKRKEGIFFLFGGLNKGKRELFVWRSVWFQHDGIGFKRGVSKAQSFYMCRGSELQKGQLIQWTRVLANRCWIPGDGARTPPPPPPLHPQFVADPLKICWSKLLNNQTILLTPTITSFSFFFFFFFYNLNSNLKLSYFDIFTLSFFWVLVWKTRGA